MIKRCLTIALIGLTMFTIPAPFKDADYKLKKFTEEFERLKNKPYSKHTEYAMGRIVGQLKANNMFTQAHFFEDDIRVWVAQAVPHKVRSIANKINQTSGTLPITPDLAMEDLGINPTDESPDLREEDAFQKKEEHLTDDQAEKQSIGDLQVEQGTDGQGSTVD